MHARRSRNALVGGPGYTPSASARPSSKARPSPRKELPCIVASVVGSVEASFSISWRAMPVERAVSYPRRAGRGDGACEAGVPKVDLHGQRARFSLAPSKPARVRSKAPSTACDQAKRSRNAGHAPAEFTSDAMPFTQRAWGLGMLSG